MKNVAGAGLRGRLEGMGWGGSVPVLLGWEGEVEGSGSLLTLNGETKAFPERSGPSGLTGGGE